MKPKSRIKLLLLLVSLSVSCLVLSPLNFKIDTVSPQNTYHVKLDGREQSFRSAVQRVKLTVVKGNETILVDDNFYREEADHPFLKEYPAREWISDSILRFANVKPQQRSGDKVVVINQGKNSVPGVKVEYASETFLIFDLAPDASVELPVLSGEQYPNPNGLYTVYGIGYSTKKMAREWRKTEAGSEILVEIVVGFFDVKES